MEARLVLFDVDGTLIRTPAGRLALDQALAQVFGVENALSGVPMMGHTDLDIVRQALARCGLPMPEDLEELWRRDEDALRRIFAWGHVPEVLPGVRELLDAAGRFPDLHLGLVTGNARRIAKVKLEAVGLWRRFPVGAFGDEHRDRAELIRMARRRAHDLWAVTPGDTSVVLVGDTPRDVHAARSAGIRAVAVASGFSPPSELEACDPDLLLPDLSGDDTLAAILGILGDPGSR